MVNILFLIGNGFDLNLGLKTSFRNILEEYKTANTNTEKQYLKDFIYELEKNNKNWSNFEKQLGEYTENFNIENKQIFLAQIDSFIDAMIEKLQDEQNRIDISVRNEHIISTLFHNSIANFQQYLPEVSRIALSPFLDTSKRNKNFNYNFISFNYTKTFERLLSVVEDRAKQKSLRFIKTGNEQQAINDIIGNVLHIHGTLDRDFILGIDNKNQIKNKELAEDEEIQSLIKPYQNSLIGENKEQKAKQLIDKSKIICIYGMSLGETDKTWWVYIYKWLIADSSRHLVIFFYNKNLNIKKPRSKISHKNNVYKLLFSHIDNINEFDIDHVKERIHIAFQNMFNIDILDKPVSTFRKTPLFSDPLLTFKTLSKLTSTGVDFSKFDKAVRQVNQASEALKKTGLF